MPALDQADAGLLRAEDWWSVWLGLALIGATLGGLLSAAPGPATWTTNPLPALGGGAGSRVMILLVIFGGLSAIGVKAMGGAAAAYLRGFTAVALMAVLARVIATQSGCKQIGLGYALWALLLGLAVSNAWGTPAWLRPGVRSELYIKIGLVLMGTEILAARVLALGGPGLMVAWLVTPAVILLMWFFGTRILKMSARRLVIVIACATSVCGVSAAIAAAAACRARKEELTLAVGITMIFTVVMMVVMPWICRLLNFDPLVAGAWLGGTIDSTGAVVAAGAMLGGAAEEVAAVVKMIQNMLIGLVAFVIAVYWVSVEERDPDAPRPSAVDIWRRFPKFVVGFLAASLLFSFVLTPLMGEQRVQDWTTVTKGLRSWCFALAFAAIGLESNFKQLAAQLVGGKPIWLYFTGQATNIVLTLIAAFAAFGGLLFAKP